MIEMISHHMKYVVILLSVIGFTGSIWAVPEPFSPEEMFNFSENVMLGKILSVNVISEPQITTSTERAGIAVYKVQVEKYFKKQLDAEILTVTGLFLREPHGMSYFTYPYTEGQNVLLYLGINKQGYGGTDLVITDPQSKVIEGTLCPQGTEYVKGICQVIKIDRMKTIGDDAPFFGFFVYLDNLVSWIFGK